MELRTLLVRLMLAVLAVSTVLPNGLMAIQIVELGEQVRIDLLGNGMIVWEEHVSGMPTTIKFAYKPVGLGWTPPVVISNALEDSFAPLLDIDDDGNAVAVWSYHDMVNMVVGLQARMRFAATGLWGPITTLTLPGESIMTRSEISEDPPYKLHVSPTGYIIVGWSSQLVAGGDMVVRVATGSFSGGWDSIATMP